jgi:uncharacterized RDD family membrane protein YckC
MSTQGLSTATTGSTTDNSDAGSVGTDAVQTNATNDADDRIEVFGEYAGFTTRLVAFVVDLMIVIASIAMITVVADLLNSVLGFIPSTSTLLSLMVALTSLVFLQAYWITFWMLAGQTPGKRLMGLRIVTVDGGRVTIGVSIRRLIGYYISAILFLGFLWVLVDNRRQGFHDKLAGTYVLYAWSFDKNLERGQSAAAEVQRRARRQAKQGSSFG